MEEHIYRNISTYRPALNRTENERQNFRYELRELTNRCEKTAASFLLGDKNARIGVKKVRRVTCEFRMSRVNRSGELVSERCTHGVIMTFPRRKLFKRRHEYGR